MCVVVSTAHDAGVASVRLFNKGHWVGSRTLSYQSTWSDVVRGIVQILLHQLGALTDLLLVRAPATAADVDAALSGVFENDAVTAAVPTLAFEKFLESYRFTGGTSLRRCIPPSLIVAKGGPS